MDRLHPETLHTLEQLVKLHGADRLIVAIREIAGRNRHIRHCTKAKAAAKERGKA